VLAVIAIVVLALNLRPVVNSVGSLLPEIRTALDLSGTAGGALTSLPPFAFAAFGLLAPLLASRFRRERVVVVALAAMTAGQVVRLVGPSTPLLFVGSLTALAGLAVCNVLMPSLVRAYFPDRVATMTAAYTTSLAIGATSSSALSVPLARGLDGDWRTGLGVWAVTAAVALVPWVWMLWRPAGTAGAGARPALPLRSLLHSRMAWTMAFFFGLQSAQAYIVTAWLSQIVVDAGADLTEGGYAVGLFAGLGIPISAAIPALLVRQSRLPVLITVLTASYVAGYVGLIVAPAAGMWGWAVLLGIGSGTFPLILTLLALRARTSEGVAALSAFTQCTGYLVATVGPVLVGALHDLTGGWTVPLIVTATSTVVMGVLGLQVARPRFLEDELAGVRG
jgi:CP family cyanate transporter-like MFS transporter